MIVPTVLLLMWSDAALPRAPLADHIRLSVVPQQRLSLAARVAELEQRRAVFKVRAVNFLDDPRRHFTEASLVAQELEGSDIAFPRSIAQ